MRELKWLVAVSLLLVLLSGCGTKVKYGTAKIESIPPGAEVINLKDSSQLGVTPVKVLFSGEENTSEMITVQLRKVGYLDRITSFWVNKKHRSPHAAELDPVDIQVELEKRQ